MGNILRRLVIILLLGALASACGQQAEGEYTSSKSVLFSTINFKLFVKGDKAELSIIQGKKTKTENMVALEEDGRLIIYEAGKEDKQLIFTILDDGNKLQFEPSSVPGFPETWVRKAKI